MSENAKIGALWNKTTKAGKTLQTGQIEIDGKKFDIAVWPNGYKERSNQPDFIIYLDEYRKKQTAQAAPPASAFPDDDADAVAAEGRDDDVPF